MGRGDKKSRRGKISKGSYGARRPRKKAKAIVTPAKPKKKATPKKAETKKEKPKKTAAKKAPAKKAATK